MLQQRRDEPLGVGRVVPGCHVADRAGLEAGRDRELVGGRNEERVEEHGAAVLPRPAVEPGQPLQVNRARPERTVGSDVRVGRQAETDEARLHLVERLPDLVPGRLVREIGVDRCVEGVTLVARVAPAGAEVIEPVEADPEGEGLGERRAGDEAERRPVLRGVVDRVAAGDRPDAAGLPCSERGGRDHRQAGGGGERVQQAAARRHRSLLPRSGRPEYPPGGAPISRH